MRLIGQKTFVQFGRWLRSRFTRTGLILGYHRVADPSASAYSMCVSPAHFAEHLEVIRRYCRPLSLTELVDGLCGDSLPALAVALTFDDGYADVLHHAAPLLERHGIPATVFVVTGCLGGEFWWDELAQVLPRAQHSGDQLRLRIGGETVAWTLDHASVGHEGCSGNRRRLVTEIYRRLLPLAPAERNDILTQLRDRAGQPTAAPIANLALTADEVQQLAGDLVEIGAHTASHPLLAALPVALQRSEIQDSKQALEALLGRPILGFSYPNGAANPATRAIVQEAGFSYACGSQPDVARRSSHRYGLPRFWAPDCDGDDFIRWLRPWLRK